MAVRLMLVAGVVALVGTACTRSNPDAGSTVPETTVVTTLPSTETSVVSVESSTTTEAPKTTLTAPSYTIVERMAGSGTGDTVVVLLDPTTYESLTDIDLYDIIVDVVERFPPITTVHVVDTAGAANIVANPDTTADELAAIADNYLARLDDGFQVTYLGPFESSGTAVLGS